MQGCCATSCSAATCPLRTRRNPANQALSRIWKGILTEEPPFRGSAWKEISQPAKNFIRSLLIKYTPPFFYTIPGSCCRTGTGVGNTVAAGQRAWQESRRSLRWEQQQPGLALMLAKAVILQAAGQPSTAWAPAHRGEEAGSLLTAWRPAQGCGQAAHSCRGPGPPLAGGWQRARPQPGGRPSRRPSCSASRHARPGCSRSCPAAAQPAVC